MKLLNNRCPAASSTFALCALLFVLCGSVQAQQKDKVFRIGFLDPSTASSITDFLQAFRQELGKLGWLDGKNIAMEFRFAEQAPERYRELAADLVRLNVDVIVVTSAGPAVAAKSATTTIPIVMVHVGDPVGAGLVSSLARPGGNITGLSNFTPQLNGKRLEILKDAVPRLTRVGILRPSEGLGVGGTQQLKEIRAAALALKLNLEEIETQVTAEGVASAFQTAKQKQVNAVMTMAGPRVLAEREIIVALAAKYRLPGIYPAKEFVSEGGLMSYGADYVDLYRRAAVYVDKILKGVKPGDLPVQQATKFEFVINLKAAKQIDLTIPVRVLERANKVIQGMSLSKSA
jgi:putative ABC transport system substrate-binding protein